MRCLGTAGKIACLGVLLLGAQPVRGQVLAAEDVIVAAVATIDSPHQPAGREVVTGAELAARRINARGGLLGRRIRVVSYLENCATERAVEVAAEVVSGKPAVVVGHLCAGAAIAAAKLYAAAGILALVPGVRDARLTTPAAGPLVFRLAGRADRFAAETAAWIADRYAGGKVAVLADRTLQARTIARNLEVALAAAHIDVALSERLESGEVSYDRIAAKVAASGAAVVIVPAQPVELGIIAAGLRRRGVVAPIVGSEILGVPEILPVARREGRGLVLMLPWTGLERVEAAYDVRTPDDRPANVQPDTLAVRLRAVAAVEVWAAAVVAAGTLAPDAVAAALRGSPVMTVVGPLAFDAAGDARVVSHVPHSWTEGRWRPLKSRERQLEPN